MYKYPHSGVEIYLLNGFEFSESKLGQTVRFRDLNGLHHAVAIELVSDPQPLCGGDFRFLRKELDMSQRRIAEMLQCSEPTVSNWERGTVEIDFLAQMAIRQLVADSLGVKTQPLRARLEQAARSNKSSRSALFFEFDGREWARADRPVRTEVMTVSLASIQADFSGVQAFASHQQTTEELYDRCINLDFLPAVRAQPIVRKLEAA
jgi:DNA-binding transcriptional regulator YiaG